MIKENGSEGKQNLILSMKNNSFSEASRIEQTFD
jgi:hypothetical protein